MAAVQAFSEFKVLFGASLLRAHRCLLVASNATAVLASIDRRSAKSASTLSRAICHCACSPFGLHKRLGFLQEGVQLFPPLGIALARFVQASATERLETHLSGSGLVEFL
jgi:hypothetical protein